MSKKTTNQPEEGLFHFENDKGHGVRLKENGDVLCTLQGYNSKAGLMKGLRAVRRSLAKHLVPHPTNPDKDKFALIKTKPKK